MGVSGGKILIVDDVADNLRLLQHMLKEGGYTSYPANSGSMALRFLQTTLPDVILMDAMMPDMDGYEVCRRLRTDPRTHDIPVIFVSAADHVLDKVKAFSCGAVDYVVKPFQQEEVLARIKTHLSLRDLQKRLEQRVTERTAELSAINAALSREIAERIRTEKALSNTRQDYKSLVDSIDGIFWELELPSFRLTYVSQQVESMLGFPQSVWLQSDSFWIERLHPDDRERVLGYYRSEAGQGLNHDLEYKMVDAGGRTVWLRNIVKVIVENGLPVKMRGVMVDITQKKTAEEQLHFIAHYDALTGLPNRALLREQAEQAIERARRDGGKVALLVIDLDYFKNINDSLGHQTGDALLREAGMRLEAGFGTTGRLARLGGDEFVLLLPGLHDVQKAAAAARLVLDQLRVPYLIDGHELHSGGSIGISVYPDDGNDVDALLRAADTAMYSAKEKGRNTYRFYTASLRIAAEKRLALESGLRQALARKEFLLYYQPKVDLNTGRIFAAEALLRWSKSDGAIVSCGEFVDIAEESGLILPIGEWALRTACQQLKRWHDTEFPELQVSVNLSARQFYQAGFQDVVAGILKETGLPPAVLELEITESMLMQPGEENLQTLAQLKAMGVQLSVDDFGVGYSSLAYLRRFPVSVLKIDRSFVNGVGENHNDAEIVSAIIAMARSLRLKVVAEDVEHAHQAAFLKEQGCDAAQGFYYSKPVPAEDFAAMLRLQDAACQVG
ncbi:two-component system response regulator [Noviherbaspirillum aerium]|uniref:two-component system response regulator n=1 Tax=Noviherbaspirillum aerium TaxID=2588497 RepID=UPI00124C5318|nr:EAL domain-containing protein [Noviherbaspirillum aerium]